MYVLWKAKRLNSAQNKIFAVFFKSHRRKSGRKTAKEKPTTLGRIVITIWVKSTDFPLSSHGMDIVVALCRDRFASGGRSLHFLFFFSAPLCC
jgi:hypothetical protein